MKKLRVLVLMHEALIPPEDFKSAELKAAAWRTEYDILNTLKKIGHEVQSVGIGSDLGVIKKAIDDFKPHIAFNLLEEFDGQAILDQNVVSFLELSRIPYTGCNPRGMMIARDKALCKKILSFHRIHTPEFVVYPIGNKIKLPKRLKYPVIVKSLIEEASLGISQASIVYSDSELEERVKFIHQKIATDALAEEYIDGREVYACVMGNSRTHVYTIWELFFKNMPENQAKIATAKAKWDLEYQKKCGITSGPAKDLSEEKSKQLVVLSKRIFNVIGLNGYARIDYRMREDGEIYVIEVNPNPQIAFGEDFADAAKHTGLSYNDLLQKILNLGIRWATNRSG
jgi:D-alanine-D-alanine ligase